MTTHDLAYTRGRSLVDYGREVEEEIARKEVIPKVEAAGGEEIISQVRKSVAHLQSIYNEDVDTIIASRRYGFISGLVKEVVRRPITERQTFSDKVDKVVTNRILGIPIFLVAMWFVFKMTAEVSGAYLDWVDSVIGGPITHWIVAILNLVNLGGTWFESLVVDGIIAGVGGVLVFVPVLLFLYFFLALLEDSGYMARAAFVMDRLMHSLGLHGKSFMPMIIGFGCTVPAIYATRTLENEDDRVLTGLLVPLMSCGARLPVYTIFAAAFFPTHAGWFIFGLYLFGIVMAIVSGHRQRHGLQAYPVQGEAPVSLCHGAPAVSPPYFEGCPDPHVGA
jgi:ferrous iron transport protein B